MVDIYLSSGGSVFHVKVDGRKCFYICAPNDLPTDSRFLNKKILGTDFRH